ncbi:cation:proton antiporter [Teretinema zuelzerae]|nr:cation:proton antiporter [Teretinema zuelzerae]
MQFNMMFALLLAGGWLSGKLFAKARLPGILGMVVFGIVCSLTIKSSAPSILWELNPYLKSFALIVILLRAGLGISRATLKKVGLTAFLMAWVPCVFETAALTALFHAVFGFDWAVSGLTAAMLAAVSPAVVVPSMLDLKAKKRGQKNEVPTIVMAGASIDDVFAITIFSVFLGLAAGEGTRALKAALSVPLSITAGIASGALAGAALLYVFKRRYATIRATEKALILLVCATVLVQIGDDFHFAALLGIMTIGFILLERHEKIAHEIAGKLSKIWVFAEIVLFVMIGFSLEPAAALDAGFRGVLVILAGLVFRSLGVWLATAFSPLTVRERLFCAIAYIPKATVQAALGGVALSRGIPEGNAILAIAVLAILVTAPLGLLGIRFFGNRLLEADGDSPVPLG